MAPPTPEIYTLSLHDALPISPESSRTDATLHRERHVLQHREIRIDAGDLEGPREAAARPRLGRQRRDVLAGEAEDRKSTRLNSSHTVISYAVFCLKKKKKKKR